MTSILCYCCGTRKHPNPPNDPARSEHRRPSIPPLHVAQILDVSIDRLLVDGIPSQAAPLHARRSRQPPAAAVELPADHLTAPLNIIDGLVAQNRLKALADGIS